MKESELAVITKSKELLLYILSVTDKSPKKFRFTLVSRLQGYALDIVEYLYLANSIAIGEESSLEELKERLDLQRKAMAKCRLLAYMSVISRESVCITPKQHKVIAEKLMEVEKLLYAWRQSDKKRIDDIRKKDV